MKMMNEEHTLMCKYENIPEVVTVSAYSTELEQLRLSSENFHQVMIEHILPEIIEPKISVKDLYEVDYYLLLRRARLATWGPVFTAGSYFCTKCESEDGRSGRVYARKKQCRLDRIEVIQPEEGNEVPTEVVIPKGDLIFTDAEVKFSMNKCRDLLLIDKVKVPEHQKSLLPMAAALRSVTGMDFIDIREAVSWLAELPAADFKILQEEYKKAFSYGLSTRGECECDVCGGKAYYYAPIDDYYFRPTVEDLKEWAKILRDSKKTVRGGKR